MGTLADLKTRIADELNRTDLTSQIALSIQSAIDFYGPESFWFQEERSTKNTADGQEYYSLPLDYISLNTIRVTVNNTNDYLLIERSNKYFEQAYNPATLYKGYPQDWTIYAQQLRLGPIPNGIYPMVIHYIKFLDDLGSDAESNAYTNRLVEQLIRFRAKGDIAANVIRDYNMATAMKVQEAEVKSQLDKQHSFYKADGSIQRYL